MVEVDMVNHITKILMEQYSNVMMTKIS